MLLHLIVGLVVSDRDRLRFVRIYGGSLRQEAVFRRLLYRPPMFAVFLVGLGVCGRCPILTMSFLLPVPITDNVLVYDVFGETR